jgi:hypothetical protein
MPDVKTDHVWQFLFEMPPKRNPTDSAATAAPVASDEDVAMGEASALDLESKRQLALHRTMRRHQGPKLVDSNR